MRVEISDVTTSDDGRLRVYFTSEVGSAWAFWSDGLPVPGETYHVELSAGEPLIWGLDIVPVSEVEHRVEYEGDGVTIYAALESCEEDGFTTLRLGNSIVMVETISDPPYSDTERTGDTGVRAHVRTLTLSDTHI